MKKLAQILLLAGLAATIVPAAPQDKKADSKKADTKEVADPVCGMTVNPKDSDKTEYKGKTYYFCSLADKKEFEKSPDKYLKAEKK